MKSRSIVQFSLVALIAVQVGIYITDKKEAPSSVPLSSSEPAALSKQDHQIQQLSSQLQDAPKEQQGLLASNLEKLLVDTFADQKISLSDKLSAYQALNDVDVADRIFPDLISLLTSELPVDDALEVAGNLGLENDHLLIEEVVATRFEADPAESLNWLLQKADKELKSDLLPELVSQWATDDIDAAEQFLRTIPASETVRDQAIGLFIHTVIRSRPETAQAFVKDIHDEDYRQYLQDEIDSY